MRRITAHGSLHSHIVSWGQLFPLTFTSSCKRLDGFILHSSRRTELFKPLDTRPQTGAVGIVSDYYGCPSQTKRHCRQMQTEVSIPLQFNWVSINISLNEQEALLEPIASKDIVGLEFQNDRWSTVELPASLFGIFRCLITNHQPDNCILRKFISWFDWSNTSVEMMRRGRLRLNCQQIFRAHVHNMDHPNHFKDILDETCGHPIRIKLFLWNSGLSLSLLVATNRFPVSQVISNDAPVQISVWAGVMKYWTLEIYVWFLKTMLPTFRIGTQRAGIGQIREGSCG
jgi:hypothetical protein